MDNQKLTLGTTKHGGKYAILPKDYKWYHGGVFKDCHVELYNRLSYTIAELEISGMNQDYLDSLLKSRHLLVESYNPSIEGHCISKDIES